MSFTESEKYYLARFLSEKHGVSIERATEFIEDPEVEEWNEYEFVSGPLRFNHQDVTGEFSREFLEKESQLYTMTKAYCRNNPSLISGYIDLVQLTAEKETELDLEMTRTWYEEDQVSEIVSDLSNLVEWLQSNLYSEEDAPDENKYIYDLNLAIMLYGLDNSENRVSVDYMNGHHTLRSKPHTRGCISEDTYTTHARSIGMRLASIFNGDKEDPIEDMESLTDEVVDSLAPYYEGPIQQLVHKVEETLKLHDTKE